ncbi:MAG: flagellar biosynthetic protein FliO [Candidatus Hydrogenedentes bacterium]|nr:flagellar biosynthetic protein FliO [Candidatus Hydrogenedentota bacterium]
MSRRCALALALALAPLAAFAQPAAPLSTPPADTPAQPAPTIDVAYPAQEGATAPAAPDLVQQKIQQVNLALENLANTTPPIAAAQTQPAEWSPLQKTLRALFGLLAALALLFLLGYLAKRYGKNTPLFAGGDLAKLMGKVYLSPRASLHFVRTGGRILVLGVTPNSISAVAEFDSDSFEPISAESSAAKPSSPAAPGTPSETESFLAQFKASLESIAHATPSQNPEQDDTEIAALREDVQRLQRYLQESVRGGENP